MPTPTTRAPRGQERDGCEYHFTDVDTFRQMVAAGQFFEHAHVHGNWYGTSRKSVETLLAAGALSSAVGRIAEGVLGDGANYVRHPANGGGAAFAAGMAAELATLDAA